MNKSLSLSKYISSRLRIYQFGFPIVLAVLLSVLTACVVLFAKVTSDQTLIRELVPHISTLVESQDRTELLRLIRSVARENSSEIVIVKNNQILAASKSLDLLDTKFDSALKLFDFAGSEISKNFISTTREIYREGGPKTETSLILKSQMSPIVLVCVLSAFIMLIFGFGISFLFAFQIQKVVQKAIKPIEQIDLQIRSLEKIETSNNFPSSGILEFEVIQSTILETQKALADSRDIKAISKAKKMTAQAYQQLIHDLDVPLSALQQMIVTSHSGSNLADKERASLAVPKLAAQIFSQIRNAKENLSVTVDVLSLDDVRDCLEDSILQSQQALSKNILFSKSIPAIPIVVAHNSNQLRRALSNLISNAIHACKQNVHVTLSEEKEKIVIKVEDDGDGMNSENVSAFLQGKGQSTKANRIAYGLAGANHIVRLHGGRIVAKKSNLGGACFEVHI